MKSRRQKKQVPMTRRDLMKMMGGAALISTPLQMIISGLVDGLVQKAYAEYYNPALPVRNFILLYFGGGIIRWRWDQPLTPFTADSTVIKPSNDRDHVVINKIGPNGIPIYASTPITRGGVTVNMPHLWSCTIPTTMGGEVPMGDLLTNMAMIRGIDVLFGGHVDAQRVHTRPSAAAHSLDGAVADRSSKPVPAAAGTHSSNFRSLKGNGVVDFDQYSSDPIGQVLLGFDRSRDNLLSTYNNRRLAMDVAVNSALSKLGALAKSNMEGSEALYTIRNQAEPLIRSGIGDVAAEFATLKNKYQDLIDRCNPANPAASLIPGVTDTALLPANATALVDGKKVQIIASGTGLEELTSDIRSMFQHPNANNALYNRSAKTNLDRMASGFAVAEYLIRTGKSSSVTASMGYVTNAYYKTASGVITNGEWGFDEHSAGAWTSMMMLSFVYKSLSACLYELIRVLKSTNLPGTSNNLFDETVINIASDFNRSPDYVGFTGHAPEASSTSIFSGVIKQPYVVGNTLLNGGMTRGVAATTFVDNANTIMGIGHSSSTIANLLRVDPPLANNQPLIKESQTGGTVSQNVETAKNKLQGEP